MSRPKQKVKITWSKNFAYAIGVLASDGNISPDLRHINLTSKDREMIENFKVSLRLDNKIGMKSRGHEIEKKYYVIQFGDVKFVEFLKSIGLTTNKSKTIKRVIVPEKYFFDFLRGIIDGDGCIDFFRHPESRHIQPRVRIASASKYFLNFLLSKIRQKINLFGGFISKRKRSGVYILTFAKSDTLRLLAKLYYATVPISLSRKRHVAEFIIKSNMNAEVA